MGALTTKLKHAWNAFVSDEDRFREPAYVEGAFGSVGRPDRPRRFFSNERSIISSIYTRISIDVAAINFRHARLDDQDRFQEEIPSYLNNCLKVEANLDQAASAFRQDIVETLFDKGVAVIVPVVTTLNPQTSGGFDIKTMRVGEVVQWYPQHVKVSVYNEAKGKRFNLILEKKTVAIVYNPLYQVMNEPNSTLQRLIRKLNMLDVVDEASSSGKLDLIIQLPYVVKSESRRTQAEQRRKDIELQLKGSQYGIAYTDGTEKVTQLNRPTENNLLKQVEYLTTMLYGQLGITEEIMSGTADEAAMLNYHNRTIEPITRAIKEAMDRAFLTKTARAQKQAILPYRDPLKFVPIGQIAEIADKLARNEIASSNEIRTSMGWKPSKDPKADELRNSNMPAPSETAPIQPMEGDSQNAS